MNEDRLREELESLERLAPAASPPPRVARSWRRGPLVGALVLVSVAAAAVLVTGVVLTSRPPVASSSPPAASSSPPAASSSPVPTTAPSLVPSPPSIPPSPASVLEWTEVASLPVDEGFVDQVNDATAWAGGIVAVGARYISPELAYDNPIPAHGLVWLSPDGNTWEDVTPDDAFDGVELTHIYEALDGSLTAIGLQYVDFAARYWRSTDGRSWVETAAAGRPTFAVRGAERGPLGYLIAGFEPDVRYELLFSSDGLSWERVRTEPMDDDEKEYLFGIAAGPTGFAAFGEAVAGMSGDLFTLTSPDGRQWNAPSQPVDAGVTFLVALEERWIAVATRRRSEGGPSREPPTPTVWTSPDGSRWRQVGTLTINPPPLEGDPSCGTQVMQVVAAGRWLVLSADFTCSYGADDGRLVRGHLHPMISLDGSSWQPLPLDGSSSTPSIGLHLTGLTVRVAVETDSGLLLGGESNGRATFWMSEGR